MNKIFSMLDGMIFTIFKKKFGGPKEKPVPKKKEKSELQKRVDEMLD